MAGSMMAIARGIRIAKPSRGVASVTSDCVEQKSSLQASRVEVSAHPSYTANTVSKPLPQRLIVASPVQEAV